MNTDWFGLIHAPGEKLHSLRNEVCRVPTPYGCVIRKRYGTQEAYLFETQRLAQLKHKGIHVPAVLFHTPCVAFLEDVGDATYVDVLDRVSLQDEATADLPAKALVDFLFSYYAATNELRGDVNLRNFMYRDGICFGIDFEESPSTACASNDMGRILAYVLTYDPAFCDKNIFFAHAIWKHCLQRNLCAQEIWKNMQSEFEAMNQRRAGFAPLYEKARSFAPAWEGLNA